MCSITKRWTQRPLHPKQICAMMMTVRVTKVVTKIAGGTEIVLATDGMTGAMAVAAETGRLAI